MVQHPEYIKDSIFSLVGTQADALGLECYVVGGYVRDQWMGRPLKMDIDFVVVGSGIALAKAVQQQLKPRPKLTVFKNFGTAHMNFEGVDLEFVGARKESYNRNS
ncbi:MAG: tRNA nucleotidyltransferase, partial [Schleiferiaceae bacterium]|nr:tRNA nucleotidyltransferase [Schleiferiaceae bacterium]